MKNEDKDVKKISVKLNDALQDLKKAECDKDHDHSEDAKDDDKDQQYAPFQEKQKFEISDKLVEIVDAIIEDLQKLQDALHDAKKGLMTQALVKVVSTIKEIFTERILPALTKK